MSIKKLLGRSQRRIEVLEALKQDALRQADEKGEEYQGIRRKREVLDGDSLEKAREELRELKRAKRTMKRAGRRANIELERAKGPRSKSVFMYKAGDLVTVRRDIYRYNIPPLKMGTIGIVLDTDPTGQDYLHRFEENRMLWVMNGESMEEWDAKWVEWVDDIDEDCEDEIEQSDDTVSENFEILESDTNIHTEEENLIAAFVTENFEPEAQSVDCEFTGPQAGDFVMYVGPGCNLYRDKTLLEPIGSVTTTSGLIVVDIIMRDEQQTMLEVIAGDSQGIIMTLNEQLEAM
jgi:hypothetical protein